MHLVEFCCFERFFIVKSTFLDLRANRKEFCTDKMAATYAPGFLHTSANFYKKRVP